MRICLFVSAMSVVAATYVAAVDDPTASAMKDSVLAVYTENAGLNNRSGALQLIVGAWPDGTVVWSADRLKGGPPYKTANVNPASLEDALNKLSTIGVFSTPSLKDANFGPDSHITTMLLRHNGKELKMASWHELFESNGKIVCTGHGATSLEGRTLLEALRDESPDDLQYRLAWLEIRLAAANLIPTNGLPTTGTLTLQNGNIAWSAAKE